MSWAGNPTSSTEHQGLASPKTASGNPRTPGWDAPHPDCKIVDLVKILERLTENSWILDVKVRWGTKVLGRGFGLLGAGLVQGCKQRTQVGRGMGSRVWGTYGGGPRGMRAGQEEAQGVLGMGVGCIGMSVWDGMWG